jgi:hypothetical protein
MQALQETDLRDPAFFCHVGLGLFADFLRNFLQELLQNVDLQTGIHAWFMHDGAPQHLLLAVDSFLNILFPEHCVDQPAHDLCPLDFYL